MDAIDVAISDEQERRTATEYAVLSEQYSEKWGVNYDANKFVIKRYFSDDVEEKFARKAAVVTAIKTTKEK